MRLRTRGYCPGVVEGVGFPLCFFFVDSLKCKYDIDDDTWTVCYLPFMNDELVQQLICFVNKVTKLNDLMKHSFLIIL